MPNQLRTRRKRRQYKQAATYGKAAKPSHSLIGARTGAKRSHNLKGLKRPS